MITAEFIVCRTVILTFWKSVKNSVFFRKMPKFVCVFFMPLKFELIMELNIWLVLLKPAIKINQNSFCLLYLARYKTITAYSFDFKFLFIICCNLQPNYCEVLFN